MGLAWQQGPLAPHPAGRLLSPDPLPERLLFAEPLRRRMRVRCGGEWIAESEDVVLLHEPGDRKSTRLNSSHSSISYAVFCSKKKKKKKKIKKKIKKKKKKIKNKKKKDNEKSEIEHEND